MKRKLLVLFALTLCLTGCQDKKKVEISAEIPTEVTSEIKTETEAEQIIKNAGFPTSYVVPVLGKDLLVEGEGPNNTDYYTITLTYGDEKISLDQTGYIYNNPVDVFETGDDSFYVFVQYHYDNDWVMTELVSYTANDGFTRFNTVNGMVDIDKPITTDKCTINGRADIFGTYSVAIEYNITEDGLMQAEDYIEIVNKPRVDDGSFFDEFADDSWVRNIYDENGRNILIIENGFTAKTEAGNLELKSGDIIYPTGYNPNGNIFYFEFNGTNAYVEYEKESYRHSINGVDEYDIFVEVPYAG